MEIPEYVSRQIQNLVQRARAGADASRSHPVAGRLSSTRGQTDFLREKMGTLGANLDPEIESQLQRIIDIADDPSSNEYLNQIFRMLEELQKGRNWDSSA